MNRIWVKVKSLSGNVDVFLSAQSSVTSNIQGSSLRELRDLIDQFRDGPDQIKVLNFVRSLDDDAHLRIAVAGTGQRDNNFTISVVGDIFDGVRMVSTAVCEDASTGVVFDISSIVVKNSNATQYSLGISDHVQHFSIDASSGAVSLLGRLKYELATRITIMVFAEDMDEPCISGKIELVVDIDHVCSSNCSLAGPAQNCSCRNDHCSKGDAVANGSTAVAVCMPGMECSAVCSITNSSDVLLQLASEVEDCSACDVISETKNDYLKFCSRALNNCSAGLYCQYRSPSWSECRLIQTCSQGTCVRRPRVVRWPEEQPTLCMVGASSQTLTLEHQEIHLENGCDRRLFAVGAACAADGQPASNLTLSRQDLLEVQIRGMPVTAVSVSLPGVGVLEFYRLESKVWLNGSAVNLPFQHNRVAVHPYDEAQLDKPGFALESRTSSYVVSHTLMFD